MTECPFSHPCTIPRRYDDAKSKLAAVQKAAKEEIQNGFDIITIRDRHIAELEDSQSDLYDTIDQQKANIKRLIEGIKSAMTELPDMPGEAYAKLKELVK